MQATTTPGTPQVFTGAPPGSSPSQAYQAVREKREVLGDQMSRLLNRRDNLAERLHSPNLVSAERAALEQHMKELTTRIVDMEKLLHAADAEVAAAAGIPGAAVPESSDGGPVVNEDIIGVGVAFAGVAVVILAVAYARRLWRGASTVVAQLPATFEARFTRMEQSIDEVAIEVERVSEGQRYLTKVFADQRAVGAGAAQPIEAPVSVPEAVRRG